MFSELATYISVAQDDKRKLIRSRASPEFHTSMELSLNIDVQQRFRLETQLSYASELRAFERFRPEVDIPPS